MLNDYVIRGDTTAILLNRLDGSVIETLIDTEDLEKVKSLNRKWFLSEQISRDVVIAHTVGGKASMYLAREILGLKNEFEHVTYRNHNPLDNRKGNLIVTNKSGSGLNRKGPNTNNNSSGIVGVTWSKKANKWVAQITYRRKNHYLGLFETSEEAANMVESTRKRFIESESF